MKKISVILLMLVFVFLLNACADTHPCLWPSLLKVDEVLGSDASVLENDETFLTRDDIGRVIITGDPSGSMRGYLGYGCYTYRTTWDALRDIDMDFSFADINEDTAKITVSDKTYLNSSLNGAAERKAMGRYIDEVYLKTSYYTGNGTSFRDLFGNIRELFESGKVEKNCAFAFVTDMIFIENDRHGEAAAKDIMDDISDWLIDSRGEVGFGLIRIEADYAFSQEHINKHTEHYDKIGEVNKSISYYTSKLTDGQGKVTGYDGQDSAGSVKHPFYIMIIGGTDTVKEFTNKLDARMSLQKNAIPHQTLLLAENLPYIALDRTKVTVELSDKLLKLNGGTADSPRLLPPSYVFCWSYDDTVTEDELIWANYPNAVKAMYESASSLDNEVWRDYINKSIPIYPICCDAFGMIDGGDELYLSVSIPIESFTDGAFDGSVDIIPNIQLEEMLSVSLDDINERITDGSGDGEETDGESEKPPVNTYSKAVTAQIEVDDAVISNGLISFKVKLDVDRYKALDYNQTVLYRLTVILSFEMKKGVILNAAARAECRRWLNEHTLDWYSYGPGNHQFDKTPNLHLFEKCVVDEYYSMLGSAILNSAPKYLWFGVSVRRSDERNFEEYDGLYEYADEDCSRIKSELLSDNNE